MNTQKVIRKFGGLILAAVTLIGVPLISYRTAEAQRRVHRRVIIVRPVRYYDPFRHYDYADPYGGFGRYGQYVFSNSNDAGDRGYKDGFSTGSKDGRKRKSYDPQRSHYFQEAGFGNFAEAYRDGFSRGYDNGFRNADVG